MFGPAAAMPPPNIGVNICNWVHDSCHAEGIRDEPMGKCHPSGHQDEWSESVDFSGDFLPDDPEMDEEDDQGEAFLCACTWRCSV